MSPARGRGRRWLRGVRARVLTWFVALLALATLLAVLILRELLINRLESNVESGLRREVEQLRLLAAAQQPGVPVDEVFTDFLRSKVPGTGEAFATLVDGEPFLETPAPYSLLRNPALLDRWRAADGTERGSERGSVRSPEGRIEYLVSPVRTDGGPEGTFVVARFVSAERAEVLATVEVAGAVIGVLLLLASLLAWAATGRALAPVRLLTETARGLSDTDLGRRIPVPDSGDEVAELTTTFNDMLDRLERTFASQREFVQDAGHELRTPITIIRGHLELMGDDPVARRETVELVLDELQRMSRLVDDLLLLARADRRDFLVLAPVDVAHLTVEAADKARALGPRAWQLDEVAQGCLCGDRQRLTQALVQLAANAVQHTGPEDTVALGSRRDAGQVRLWVRDTGPGVPDEDREHIFQRFGRGRRARRRSEGAGLGLPIVRAIAEAHGGRVDLDSRPGQGATFTLVLPASEEGA